MKYPNTCTLVPTYSTGCFCPKPTLKPLEISMTPKFNFVEASKQCAELNNIVNLEQCSKSSGKRALGILQSPCRHFTEQVVGISWTLSK